MFKKLFIINILLISFIAALFGAKSDDLFDKKKIQIDNKLRHQLDLEPTLYHIWIGTRDDANLDSKYRIKNKKKDSKEYIPGLPTMPTAPRAPQSSASKDYNESYVIYIYLDESLNDPALKNSIEALIKADIWPALNHCDDCIQFEIKEFFKKGTKNSQGVIDDLGKHEHPELNEYQAQMDNLKQELEEIKIGIEELSNLNTEDAAKKIEEENSRLAEVYQEYEAKLQEVTDANIALERTVELAKYELEEKEKELVEKEKLEAEAEIMDLKEEIQKAKEELEDTHTLQLAYYKAQYEIQSAFKDSLLQSYGQQIDQIYNPILGCMNPNARNFNPRANTDCQNCCLYDKADVVYVEGCTDPNADNWNPKATEDNGSCEYLKGDLNKDGKVDKNDSEMYQIQQGQMPPKTPSNIDTNLEKSSSNWLMWVLLGLLVVLIALSVVIIIGNKKKVVYLKPKNNQDNQSSNSNPAVQQPAQPAQPAVPPTTAPLDEGVLQSEVQKQRQSAVAMSAGQKEGATQIIKDWLDESKNEEENTEE